MKTVLYHTVSATTAGELDNAVNALLGEGYQLYGSPYLSDGNTTFYQAMIRDQAGDKNAATVLKELAQMKEITNLKLSEPN